MKINLGNRSSKINRGMSRKVIKLLGIVGTIIPLLSALWDDNDQLNWDDNDDLEFDG